MKGVFRLADLTLQVEGSIRELVKAQSVQREFERACRKIREVAGSDDVQIVLDEDLKSEEGRTFSKVRLRAYADGKVYSIDCGMNEPQSERKTPFGIFVRWEAPVQVYDRETEETWEVNLEEDGDEDASSEPQSGATGDEAQASGTDQSVPEPKEYDPQEPPPHPTDDNGRITEEVALLLWNAAKRNGHTQKSFAKMLSTVSGVKNPQLLQGEDFAKCWEYACDPATWKMEHYEETGERELPLDE